MTIPSYRQTPHTFSFVQQKFTHFLYLVAKIPILTAFAKTLIQGCQERTGQALANSVTSSQAVQPHDPLTLFLHPPKLSVGQLPLLQLHGQVTDHSRTDRITHKKPPPEQPCPRPQSHHPPQRLLAAANPSAKLS
jgi:hypothetical protein